MKLKIVLKHFANTMITIGIFRCVTYRSSVRRVFFLQWESIDRVSFTLVNGLSRFFSFFFFIPK